MPSHESGGVRVYQSYVVGHKPYLRKASVVMACHLYNAAVATTRSDSHWFEASWTQAWYGPKLLEIRECFVP